jgi:hypothetical protein
VKKLEEMQGADIDGDGRIGYSFRLFSISGKMNLYIPSRCSLMYIICM